MGAPMRTRAPPSLPLVTKGRWHGEAVTEGMRRCTFCRTTTGGRSKTCNVLIPSVACGDSVSLRLGHGVGLTAHRAVIQHHAAASLPWSPREALDFCKSALPQKTSGEVEPLPYAHSAAGCKPSNLRILLIIPLHEPADLLLHCLHLVVEALGGDALCAVSQDN